VSEVKSEEVETQAVRASMARETVSKSKFDAQKKVLQGMTVQMLIRGEATGLGPDEVRELRKALDVLGWLPKVKL
jgi:hypothetical protein